MPTITECLDRFEVYLRHERGRKEQTIKAYLSDLRSLYRRYPVDVQNITLNDLRAYVRHLHMRGLKYRTIERHRAAFSTFWRWLRIERMVTENVVELLELPKRPPPIPKWLESSDLRKFAATPDQSRYPSARARNEIAWLLMALMGFRRSEVLQLHVKDVLLKDWLIVVRESKGADRVLPIPEALRDRLKAQIADKSPADFVLTGLSGREWNPKSFTNQFTLHRKRCGLPEWVTPHTIRHSYATHLIQRGVSIFNVQKMLGHKDIKTTTVYLHTSPDHLRGDVEKHVLHD